VCCCFSLVVSTVVCVASFSFASISTIPLTPSLVQRSQYTPPSPPTHTHTHTYIYIYIYTKLPTELRPLSYDETVPCSHSTTLYRQLKREGHTCSLLLTDAGHTSECGRNLALETYAVESFLRKHFGCSTQTPPTLLQRASHFFARLRTQVWLALGQ
jgi:hypothetical protein